MKLPAPGLLSVMLEAYRPCAYFGGCREARWDPAAGHIPRGFIGATGSLEEVEVVMVFAEPGHPHYDERHEASLTPKAMLKSGMRHTYECFKAGTDLFHVNVRWFMSQLYPDLSFDEQLRRVWLTEGRLCSVTKEIGGAKDRSCASRYLVRQLGLLPNAKVVAFGGKAQAYLKGLGIARIDASALSPPGANFSAARPSWLAAVEQIKAKRRARTA